MSVESSVVRLRVPEGTRLTGCTAGGRRASIVPGDYLVHRMSRRVDGIGEALRFVGADQRGQDVHVPLRSVPPNLDIGAALDAGQVNGGGAPPAWPARGPGGRAP